MPQLTGILLRVLVVLRLVSEIPCGTSCFAPQPLNHFCKIKNPASSAGRNHPHLSGSTRCSTSFYPVLVKNPTIGSTSRLRFSRAGRLLDPTVIPLSGPRLVKALRPSRMIPAFLNSSSPLNNYFSSGLCTLCKSPSPIFCLLKPLICLLASPRGHCTKTLTSSPVVRNDTHY